MTKVTFRVFHGEVIAIFPDIPWNNSGDLTSYEHNGQHGACSPCLLNMKKPRGKAYEPLLEELKKIYNDLVIV